MSTKHLVPVSRDARPASRRGHTPTTGASDRVELSAGIDRQQMLLKTGAFQSAIFNSANLLSIATDARGVIQIFNVGAERMLGYTAADVMNKITPADISDPQEVIARAEALSIELGTPITPGFEALVFKASRGIEDIYELTYIRKDGSRFPAVVSVTALRDAQDVIIGYLLIGTDNTARNQAEEKLRENYALLRTIGLHSIVSVTDRAGRIVDANPGFCKISGYSREELLGQTHRIVNSAVQSHAFWTDMWRCIAAGQPWRGEICNRAKDGSLYWVDSIIAPFMAEDGHTKKYISVRTDVTARKQAEEKLRGVEEMFRQLAINMPEALWIGDAETEEILYVNPILEQLTGRQLVVGDSVDKLIEAIHPDDVLRVHHEPSTVATRSTNGVHEGESLPRTRHQASRFAGGVVDQDCRLMRPDGVVRWVHIRSFPVENVEGKIRQVAGLIEDITDRKVAEARLLELAHFDPLTGLPNRRHYYESLEQALDRARVQSLFASVLFIDLDRFKEVNDSLGHALGDQLLRKVSDRMSKCVRSTDIFGRLGGDEFALVLLHYEEALDAAIVAKKLIDELHRPFDLDGHEVTVTASIGIAVYPADSTDGATLMKFSDTAMYEAKSAGRDTYRFYSAEMNTRALAKHDLEAALRKALNHGEFVLHYQPLMQIDSGQWTGAEALLRWNRPGQGLVMPGDFIPALEETGLIVAVGAWVIDTVCKQIAEWERTGLGSVAVTVNVSGRQFSLAEKIPEERRAIPVDDCSIAVADFTQMAAQALTEHGIAPNLLEFELTESTLMSDVEKTVGILRKLKSLGIRISIDDFGTGYSSLAYLRRFPIDTLKIDRAFIREVTSNTEDAAITMAIISMAHSLKMKVIAEGIETKEQLDLLRTNGCDQAQGFLLARAMPAAELTKLFRAGNFSSTPRGIAAAS